MNYLSKYKYKQKDIQINLLQSAPNQIKPIPVINRLCTYWTKKKLKNIIDVGCGKLRNSLILVKYFKLFVCDFPKMFEYPLTKKRLIILKRKKNFQEIIYPNDLNSNYNFDAAILSFVLHIIPEVKDRIKLINEIIKILKAPKYIFIIVPHGEKYYRQKMTINNKFKDGYIFHLNRKYFSFYKQYSTSELDNFMNRLGFNIEKKFYLDKKIARIYKKK